MDKPGPSNGTEKRREVAPREAVRKWLVFAGVLGVLSAFSAISYVWLRIQQVQDGYSLARFQTEQEQLLAVQRKLRLEWSQFHDLFYLEELGSKQFGLTPPRRDQKVLMR